jgi:hypothetical protein
VHEDALSPEQRRALLALRPAGDRGFYLAGGSALCLRLAHRRSIDLDLFHTGQFDAADLLRELRAAGVPFHNVDVQRSAIWFELEGVETSLLYFDHAPLYEHDASLGVPVASLADIAAMKVEAIASRGARKDFVDLYFICQEPNFDFSAALDAFAKRFADAHPDIMHRIKALTYFDDAEVEPDLLLLRQVAWEDVKAYFEHEVASWWKR